MNAHSQPDVEIHVGTDLSEAARLEAVFRREKYRVIHIDMTGVDGRRELCDRLGQAFQFPYAVSSLDAVVDLVSDLEWLGKALGYLVEVAGIDHLRTETLKDLTGLLPAICDRWRSQRCGFVVLLIGSSHRATALARLAEANGELSDAAGLPWIQETKPVKIVDHDSGAGGHHVELRQGG